MVKGSVGNATEIVKAGREIARFQEMEVYVVGLVQDPGDRLVLGSLLAAHNDAGTAVVKKLGPRSVDDVADADLAIIVVRDVQTASAAGYVAAVAARRRHTLVIVMGAAENERDRLAALLGVRANQIVPSPASEVLPESAGPKAVKASGDRRFALAAAFPAFREPAADEVISATAWQNAAVATVLGVPGADMPVLAANQIKMVLQLAAIHGETIGFERAKEIFLVLGGGLAFRTVARQALGFLPGPGWVVKGGVAYAGTLAIGKAAKRYFALGPEGRHDLLSRLKRSDRPK